MAEIDKHAPIDSELFSAFFECLDEFSLMLGCLLCNQSSESSEMQEPQLPKTLRPFASDFADAGCSQESLRVLAKLRELQRYITIGEVSLRSVRSHKSCAYRLLTRKAWNFVQYESR
jgi:hypothetical protein